MRKVYFDSAATTQLRPEVLERMLEVLENEYGNPSSTHIYGRSAKALLENSRKEIATYFNVSAAEIIFTSGGTEADNLILNSCVCDLGIDRIISSKIEHHAVLHCIESLAERHKVHVDYVNIKSCGSVDHDHLEELLKAKGFKTLVSLMHVNNEIGSILDIQKVADLCIANDALFHSDTVQSIGHFQLDFSKIPIHFAAAAAHKFHGPKGAGFAFIRRNTGVKGLILGGSQERGVRAGTEAVYAIAGMAVALKLAYTNLDEERAYVTDLKDYFKTKLSEHVPGVSFNGSCDDNAVSTYTLLNVCLPIPPKKSMMLLFQMDLKGVACSKGSACQSGSTTGSHVLNNVLSDDDLKKPSLRFSFSCFNTKEEIDYVIECLKEFVEG